MHRGVAGSCQSPVSNEVSKARQVSREDGRAGSVWQGDTPRAGGHATGRHGVPREQSQRESSPGWGAPGGQRSVVGAVPGAAGLPRLAGTLHYGIKQPSCSALAPQSR